MPASRSPELIDSMSQTIYITAYARNTPDCVQRFLIAFLAETVCNHLFAERNTFAESAGSPTSICDSPGREDTSLISFKAPTSCVDVIDARARSCTFPRSLSGRTATSWACNVWQGKNNEDNVF